VLAAVFGLIVAVVAGGVWLVDFSPVLVARSVRVEGVPRGDVSSIVGQAAVPMGTPLARVDTHAVARRVIGASSLASVTVSRSYPSTIVISASPQVPFLAVKNPEGQVQVVDSQGVAYATVSTVPKGVPLINTVENSSSVDSMRAAMAVLRALSPDQRSQVSNVTVLGPNMVTLKLGAVTVLWGGASEPQLKVQVMTDLLRQQGVSMINVSVPDAPVIR